MYPHQYSLKLIFLKIYCNTSLQLKYNQILYHTKLKKENWLIYVDSETRKFEMKENHEKLALIAH